MNITYTQNGDYLIPNIIIRKTNVPIVLACIIGSVICYFIGTLWFMFVTKMNLSCLLYTSSMGTCLFFNFIITI